MFAGLIVFVSVFVFSASARICPEIACPNFCQEGYSNGQSGCPTCVCAPTALGVNNPTCKPLTCFAPCPFGYPLEQGCPTCNCATETAVQPDTVNGLMNDSCNDIPYCIKPCPNGYEEDENGCPTCDCLDSSKSKMKKVL